MAHERVTARVQTGALVLMLAVGVELLRYSYRMFDRAWTFCFGEPDLWNKHRLVDEGMAIEFGARLGYFSIWGGIIVLLVFLLSMNLLAIILRRRFERRW